MTFQWLKRWMPRSLYGRAALILLVPVVTIQLVVSVGFIQRHYEGVTAQMARTMVLQLAFVETELAQAADPPAKAAQLGAAFDLSIVRPAPAPPVDDGRVFYDLSGPTLQAALAEGVPGLRMTAFDGMRRVTVWIDGPSGAMAVSFDRRRVSASNPHQLLVLMVVLGALMTLIAYLYLRNQLRPITRLAAAAAEYGRGRQVAYQPSGATEVRAAGTAFLDMRQRIERQAQTRTLMLSGVSHDLRTPLTRLRLGLSLLDDPEAAGMIGDVDEMSRMVDSFLDFARADAQAETGDPMEPADAVALIAGVVARAGRGVTAATPEGDVVLVPLRPMAIRRAVENLVSNACRHGRRVEVGLAFTDRALRISVEDDGPGIPPDRRDEAMRPFVRLDPARGQDQGSGVGLGLAIVADIARAHGGVLRLGQSDRLGGLRADLVLPR